MRLRIVVTIALAVAGYLVGLLSFVFCSSSYVEDELQELFDADDAMLVAVIGALALLGLLGAALLLPQRRLRYLLPLLAAALVVAAQVTGASVSGVCLSLPGVLQGGHWWMRAE